jgi:hypothetical protein
LIPARRGNGGLSGGVPPLSTKVGTGWPCSIGLGQSEGPEESRLRKLRPYERSRCAEHGRNVRLQDVRAPPGIDMVAPLEFSRNAERAQSEGRVGG